MHVSLVLEFDKRIAARLARHSIHNQMDLKLNQKQFHTMDIKQSLENKSRSTPLAN